MVYPAYFMALPAEQGQLAVPVVTVNKVFKGTAEKSPTGPAEENEIRMLVPQGLQSGETYLFFRTNGLANMPSRSNSVISVESEEYAQIIEQIQ